MRWSPPRRLLSPRRNRAAAASGPLRSASSSASPRCSALPCLRRCGASRPAPGEKLREGQVTALLIAPSIVAAMAFALLFRHWLHLRRAEFIRTYRWPPGLLERLEKRRPGLG